MHIESTEKKTINKNLKEGKGEKKRNYFVLYSPDARRKKNNRSSEQTQTKIIFR
jgi:hypothetical protein